MLNFILGTAGTGKTTQILNEINQLAWQNEKMILLVPEQFSYQSERAIHTLLLEKNIQVEVLSFTRLCNHIFREFGDIAGTYVTDISKNMIMSIALNEVREHLKLYKKHTLTPPINQTFIHLIESFKNYGVSPKSILQVPIDDENLKDKMHDISLIYSAYQSIIDTGFKDSADDITRAIRLLEGQDFFSNYHIFIDGFTAFSLTENTLLECMIRGAKNTTIALTTNTLTDDFLGASVFSASIQTANRLMKMAENNAVPISSPIFLNEPKRFASEELSFLSQNFMMNSQPYGKQANFIRQITASNPYDEISYIACEISNLIKTHGYRYHDFAIITRDLDPYLSIIRDRFDFYDIPYFLDERYDIQNNILVRFLCCALEVTQENFSTQSVIAYSKSPLLALSVEQSCTFEEYVYVWDIKKDGFLSDFKNNPNGFDTRSTDDINSQLEALNSVRKILIEPLIDLKTKLSSANGKQFATAIYHFLEQTGAKKQLFAYAQHLPKQDEKEFLEQCAAIWDIIINILDVFGELFASYHFTSKRFFELFKLALCTADIGIIPQTLDQVLVGLADRTRPNDPKVVFIINGVDGVFPKTLTQNTIFSNIQIEQLKLAGIDFSDEPAHQTALEKYYAYYALTCPSHWLYVSYPTQNLAGNQYTASIIVDTLCNLFPNITVKTSSLSPLNQIVNQKSAQAYLAKTIREDTPLTVTLRNIVSQAELEKIDYVSQSISFKMDNQDTTKQLFGTRLHLSPSKLEQYHRCAFSYFCSSGLKLKKKKKVDFSPLESGTVIHSILQIILSKYNKEALIALSEKQLKEEIRIIIQSYLTDHITDDSILSKRFHYLFTRLVSTTYKLIRHLQEEFLQSDFIPTDFELEIGQNTDDSVSPLELVSQFGTKISIHGTVDRVDIMQKNGKKYVRVLDYKSGSKSFALTDIYYGLNLQMLVYLFSIWQNGTGVYKDVIPAGILYVPVPDKQVIISADDRTIADEKIATEVSKTLKMNGLLLDDIASISGMERDMAGVFIPAKLKKDGSFDATSSLVTLTKLSKIKTHIEKIITDMADALIGGRIAALPVQGSNYDPCSYCDYQAVCGFEVGDSVKEIEKISNDEFYTMIGEFDHE